MSLAPCRECGRQISLNARACPGCGDPISRPPNQAAQKPFIGRFLVMIAGVFAMLWGIATTLGYFLGLDVPLDSPELRTSMIFAFGLGIYLLPAWIADGRGHPNRSSILLLNLLLGWTLLGWAAALIWSASAVKSAAPPAPPTPSLAAVQTDPAAPPA